jgi:hypothetical protein
MRVSLFSLLILLCLCPAMAQTRSRSTNSSSTQSPVSAGKVDSGSRTPSTLQFEFRVPFDPTVFPNGSRSYGVYEIYFTNFSSSPLTLKRIEVLDADRLTAAPVLVLEGAELAAAVRFLGTSTASNAKEGTPLSGGQTVIAFLWVAFDRNSRIPARLLHRVVTDHGESEGAAITTHESKLRELGPPLEGRDWLAADGPSNDQENHHRRGVYIYAGEAIDSRRYAIDWKQVRNGVSFSGDALDVRSYYAYRKNVLAVADGRVIMAKDGIPNNIPGHGEAFHPAVPITYETAHGNTIILDLGGGQFAHYHHLEPGSLLVKAGDHVRKGQILAQVGDSGDTREPHLHFEVTTSAREGMGEGIPYLIDRYYCKCGSDGSMELRVHELPLGSSIVTFGGNR